MFVCASPIDHEIIWKLSEPLTLLQCYLLGMHVSSNMYKTKRASNPCMMYMHIYVHKLHYIT